jgi:flagellar assembly protein FliH
MDLPMSIPFDGAMILFEEDFDAPVRPPVAAPLPPEPEIIEPSFSTCELDAARAEGREQGHAEALAAAVADTHEKAQAALATLANDLAQVQRDARSLASEAADAIAQLLLASLAAAFPSLCERHGQAEIHAIVRRILPALHGEPKIIVRVPPTSIAGIEQEFASLDTEFGARIHVVTCETLSTGDVRVSWQAGQAERNTARLWQDIEAILAPTGLLPAASPGEDTIDVN